MTTAVFDPAMSLPAGRLVVEASAGTGKTHAVTTLVLRELALGTVTAGGLLVVTFTVPAAAELRERVRTRLDAALDELERRGPDPAGGGPLAEDAVTAALEAGAGVTEVTARLRRARLDLEQATITTIDGFAARALGVLGALGDHDRTLALVPDDADLVEAAVHDAIVRAGDGAPGVTDLRRAVRRLLEDPDARPSGHDPATAALLHEVVADVRARRRAVRRTTYADVLHRLLGAVAEDPAAQATLRDVFRLVVVDESQDTSPLQWAILDAVFPPPARTVVVGDPKQSIYLFRGADVTNHLRARANADERARLDTSWRADGDLVEGLERLWAPATFGGASIQHTPVQARPGAPATALAGDDVPAVQVRALTDADRTPRQLAELVVSDLVGVVRRLLGGDVQLTETGPDGATTTRPVRADDVAVLVRRNTDATWVRRALVAAGVDAMVDGAGSVLGTEAADWWERLLAALANPGDDGAARWAATTPWYGIGAGELGHDDPALGDRRDPAAVDALHATLQRWAEVLRTHGVAALVRAATDERQVPGRVLTLPGGDGRRALVDLQHVADLLHDAQRQLRLAPEGLLAWLRDVRDGAAGQDVADLEAHERRLETDRPAVRVATVHRAKGREYPVVLLPFMSDPGDRRVDLAVRRESRHATIHLRDDPGHAAAKAAAVQQLQQERWRHLYVGMTRAQHRVVTWWAPVTNHPYAPLTVLLFDGADDDRDARVKAALKGGAELHGLLRDHLRTGDAAIEVVERTADDIEHGATHDRRAGTSAGLPRSAEVGPAATWTAGHAPDDGWRRTSYSGLRRLLEGGETTTGRREHTVAVTTDETDVTAAPVVQSSDVAASAELPALPLAGVPGGAELGTLVHEALERVDFTSRTLVDDLASVLGRLLARRSLRVDPLVVARGLAAAVDTPLGSIADGRALADVAPADRLDELAIAMPLAPGGGVDLRSIGHVLADHVEAPDGHDAILARYSARLLTSGNRRVAVHGELEGAVDLVVRWPAAGGGHRHLVVDHKSNRLGAGGRPLLDDYHPDRLADAMVSSDYLLQALLYLVAVRRFLRWRLGGDPDAALAGVAWTFLRGMVGRSAPVLDDGRAHGVFAWVPPPGLLADLDALLAAGRAATMRP